MGLLERHHVSSRKEIPNAPPLGSITMGGQRDEPSNTPGGHLADDLPAVGIKHASHLLHRGSAREVAP
eukprot:15077096-Alexandrium_andersonii.AAC.1